MSLVRNERLKLTAAWFNAISAASIAVGGFAQLAPLLSGTLVTSSPAATAAFTAIWFTFGIALHLGARWYLGRLEE